MGGLGNQMFQYAVGRSLALKWHCDLYLDLEFLVNTPQNTTSRSYELDIFNIKANIASKDILKCVPLSRKDNFRLTIQKIFGNENVIQYVKERTIDFDRCILDLPDNVYLDGYWQSEKYFVGIRDIIINDFVFLKHPSESNQKILNEIQKCNSVSIHIRRGDYISNPKTRRIHFICDDSYYQKALEIIMRQIEKPHFFVFSDDAEWARTHIIPDARVRYITHNIEKQNYEDLRLMMHCQHHIIANSSFSWWGAWLGKKEGQVVIAPGKWFNTKNYKSSARLPSTWLIADTK
jgi:hypothetical protein